jgi:hypothetical protein
MRIVSNRRPTDGRPVTGQDDLIDPVFFKPARFINKVLRVVTAPVGIGPVVASELQNVSGFEADTVIKLLRRVDGFAPVRWWPSKVDIITMPGFGIVGI